MRPDWLPQLEDAAAEAGFDSVSKLLSYLLMKHVMGLDYGKEGFCQPINTAEQQQIDQPYKRSAERRQDSLRNLEAHDDKYSDFDGCADVDCERHCVPITALVHPEWLPRLEESHDCFGSDTVGGILIFLVEKYVLGIEPFKTGHMCQPIIKSTDKQQ